jgi:hypothetical protein
VTDEQLRLAHLAACEAVALSAVPSPSPSPQPQPESHTEAMAVAHQGRPTAQQQQKRDWRVFP